MTAPARAPASRAWVALVGLALPLFALSVDAYGVGVLLPDIAESLRISTLQTTAVITAAAIGTAAPLLFVGRLADRWGPRPLLLGGIAAFMVASAVCAAAGSFGVLVVGRGLQGVASACCFTTSLAVIDGMFDDRRRPIAVGIWAAIGGVGGAVGPVIASVVASLWSWRAFFAVNLAIGAVALVVLALVVPHRTGDRSRPLDAPRLLVLALGLALSVGALQHLGGTDGGPVARGLLLLGAVLVAASVVRAGRGPLVARSVTAPWPSRAGTAVATTSNWGSGVVFALVPPALATARGMSVLATGLLLVAFSAPFAVGGAVSGPLVRRFDGFRTCAAASVVQALGLAGLGLAGVDAPIAVVVATLAVAGLGNGVVYSAATSLGLADIATADAGEASGVLTMWRLLGLTVGVAVSGMVVDALTDRAFGQTDGIAAALLLAAAITAAGALVAVRRAAPTTSPG